MITRTLQIEATGDFWRGKIKPKIRLGGNWLERAGFKPGSRVEVHCDQPGTVAQDSVRHFLGRGIVDNPADITEVMGDIGKPLDASITVLICPPSPRR